MRIKNVHVIYDDATEEDYSSIIAAQQGINKTSDVGVADVSATTTSDKHFTLYCQRKVALMVYVKGIGLRPAGVLDDSPE